MIVCIVVHMENTAGRKQTYNPPAGFRSWGDLLEYCEDRDHADYRDATVGELLRIYASGEECPGHPDTTGIGDPDDFRSGETVYCDGSCIERGQS